MSLIWLAISAAVLSLGVSAYLTLRFSRPESVFYILDHPNERSLHKRAVPRGGGLAILSAIIAVVAALSIFHPLSGLVGIATSLFIVASISYIDDRYAVAPAARLAVHTGAALIVLYAGFFVEQLEIPGMMTWNWPYMGGAVFSAVFIVWMINLYNFMDGMDGFAGGMAVFGFGTFAIMGWMSGNEIFSILSLIIAAASLGFLFYNFPPAKIFMGDIGSSGLGLLAASFSLWGVRDGIFSFWAAVLVFSPFIMDATVTLVRRVMRREKFWQAHKTHYYQRLVQSGWGHRRTVQLEYGIMLGCGLTALYGLRAANEWQAIILAGWAAFYLLFFFWISRKAIPQR